MVTSNEPVSNEEMEQKIAAQVEYYFGDLNLKQDKFMKYHMHQNEGWFPIDKLMTFNRLKSLTTDQEQVVNCIKSSTNGVVELSEDGTKLRRTKPIPEESEEYIKELNLRTLHLKGFPKDSQLDDIMAFCAEYGKVQSIQMRRNFRKDNEFKGCIMVTYLSQEDADKALASELKYKEIELLKENKEKYFERKKAFYDSLKKKKESNASDESNLVKTKGAILKVTGLTKETKFGEIKDELTKHSKVAFVSNVNDKSECHVRFAVEDGAKEALKALKALKEKADDKSEETEKTVSIELCGQKVEVTLVSEEEEKQFWREFQSKQFAAPNNKKNKWQKGKKRFNHHDNGGRRNKMAKTGGDAGGD